MEDRQPTPDEIEQRQRADGGYDDDDLDDIPDDDLVDPDVLEQRQEVEYDEDDYRD